MATKRKIPTIPKEQLGTAIDARRRELLEEICELGEAVPREWLLKELGKLGDEKTGTGPISVSSMHSLVKRAGFRAKSVSVIDGSTAVIITHREDKKTDTEDNPEVA